jgi:hypothetical protein
MRFDDRYTAVRGLVRCNGELISAADTVDRLQRQQEEIMRLNAILDSLHGELACLADGKGEERAHVLS